MRALALSRFLLVDPSLSRPGGHHHPAAWLWLAEAERRGLRPGLAVARRARGLEPAIERGWSVERVFRDTREHWPLPERHIPHRVRSTVRGLESLIERGVVAAGGALLFPTVHPLDLVALTEVLASGRLPPFSIHVQLQQPLLEGRPPAWPEQRESLERHRRLFEELAAVSRGHRLGVSALTETLADQIRLLGVQEVSVVPYPLDPGDPATVPAACEPGPVRVLLGGGLREEKGRWLVGELSRRLRPRLDAGEITLWVQSGGSWIERSRRRLSGSRSWRRAIARSHRTGGVVWIPHPLSAADYRDLLQAADAALFLYDPVRYASRHSGVFCEARAAGLPVLVPAETWMADQVAASAGGGLVYRDLDQLPKRLAELTRDFELHRGRALEWAPSELRAHRLVWPF